MLSNKRNSITAWATGLIFSLFNFTSAQEVSFGILQYIQFIIHGLTSILLCVPFTFADSERCQFGGTCDGLCVTEIVCNFHSGYFDYRDDCRKVLDLYGSVTA